MTTSTRTVLPPALHVITLLAVVSACCGVAAADPAEIDVPASDVILHVARELPPGWRPEPGAAWELHDAGGTAAGVAAQVVPAIAHDGTPATDRWRVLATLPPADKEPRPRRLTLRPIAAGDHAGLPPGFRFAEVAAHAVELRDGDKPAWVYNHGDVTNENLPADAPWRTRGCYLHPVWDPAGAVLTDDFPADHPFHRGIFWAWPHVTVDGREHDQWSVKGVRQRFVRWLCRETGPVAAVLAVENGWFSGDEKVMTERVWIHTYRGRDGERTLDLSLVFMPATKPVTLAGREGKSYGGLVFRFDVWPRRDGVVRTPGRVARHVGAGLESAEDRLDTRLEWADLAAGFAGGSGRSGAAIFVPPSHPDFPPTWMTRCYGPLCVGWPGTTARTFEPGKPFGLSYRIWLHAGEVEADAIARTYRAYVDLLAR